MNGYWQNQSYFKNYKKDIYNLFSFKNSVDFHLEKNSVAVHVRRGDYVTNKLARDTLGVLPISYYKKSMILLARKINNPIFYIFSDDIEWVKKNFDFESFNIKFIENSKAYEDLQCMSLCAHNIVANSSFSWWGAWLNNNPEKIVIAPQRWYESEQKNEKLNRIPQNWIRI